MYNAHITNQPVSDPKMVKKEIFDKVYIKIANSLSEFNLHGKKFEEQLKKVSKLFTKDITKASKKKKKQA